MSHSFSLISTLAIGFAIAWALGFLMERIKYRHWLATCSPVLLFRPQHPDLWVMLILLPNSPKSVSCC